MCRILAFCILFLTAAHSAYAGAWMREQGSGFLAVSATLHQNNNVLDYKSAVYAEWGFSPRLTLGFDLNERPGLSGHALLFSRFPIADLNELGRFAAEVGLGAHHGPQDWHPMYKFTLSYGLGFAKPWGSGWLAVDAAMEHRTGAGDPFYKLDLTAGLSNDRQFNPLLQLETTHIKGAPILWTVTPSVMIKAKKNIRWVVGLENKSAYPKGVGLKISLWREF